MNNNSKNRAICQQIEPLNSNGKEQATHPLVSAVERIQMLGAAGGISTLAAAEIYTACGIPIIPVDVEKKCPLISTGKDHQQGAFTDPREAVDFLAKCPNAGLATPLGAKSNLIVIDVDVRPDRNGRIALKERLEGLDIKWKPLAATTQSNGLHLYATYPNLGREIRLKSSPLGIECVDVL